MNARSYITALFDEPDAAAEAVKALARLGVRSDEICAAIAQEQRRLSFCRETGAIELGAPIAEQLREIGGSIERATHCERRVASGSVLLLLPASLHAEERLELLRAGGADAMAEPSDDTVRVPIREEQLRVSKRTVSDGEVRVRKVVASVMQHVDVPLRREAIVITRTQIGASRPHVLRIPLSHEEFDITKHTVLVNEVTIRRESTESIARIEEPLRHERLQIRQVDSSAEDHASAFAANSGGNSSDFKSAQTMETLNDMYDTGNEMRAYFPERTSAEAAADDLRGMGFADRDVEVHGSERGGFLEAVKRFFEGESLDTSDEGGAFLIVRGGRRDDVESIVERYDGRMASAENMQTATAGASDQGTVKLHEERLNVTKHAEKEGEVRLTKDVATTQQELDVPVKREEVVVTRRRVDEPDDSAEIGDGEEVRIPVLRDEVDVEKERVTTEEVGVEKRAVESTEHVSESLQKERARLETDGHVGTTLKNE